MNTLRLLLIGLLSNLIASGQVKNLNQTHSGKLSQIKIVTPDPEGQPQQDPVLINTKKNFAICQECSDGKFIFNAPAPPVFSSNNGISFVQPVSVTTTPPKSIKSISAELVYFEMVPDNDLCVPCNKDELLYGHFGNGTNSIKWDGAQTSLNINITTPVTPCCGTFFRWCIRYKVEFSDCVVCSKLICYEMSKEGCSSPDGIITGTQEPGFKKSN